MEHGGGTWRCGGGDERGGGGAGARFAIRLTSRCNDVLRPFTGGRPGLIIITNMMTKSRVA